MVIYKTTMPKNIVPSSEPVSVHNYEQAGRTPFIVNINGNSGSLTGVLYVEKYVEYYSIGIDKRTLNNEIDHHCAVLYGFKGIKDY